VVFLENVNYIRRPRQFENSGMKTAVKIG